MRNGPQAGSSAQGPVKDAMKPAIRLASVRKEYRLYNGFSDQALDVLGLAWARFWQPVQYRTFAALDGIDLEIGHGERVGIVGRNGAGKTTLLKLITGNFAPTAGEIEVDGQVQALMQTGLGFHGEFTGLENIRASLVYNGLMDDELEAAVEDVIDFCELGDFLYQPVKTYSLGMRARLQFAAATAIKPDIVIIDEVLGAGDAYFSVKSAERMARMASSGCTMLLVSHSMSQVMQFCDRAIWVHDGHIRDDGPVRSIVGAYEVFMRDMSDKHAGSAKAVQLAGSAHSTPAEPAGLVTKLADGKEVYRWPGESGVKLDRIDIYHAGRVANEFPENATIEFRAQLRCDHEQDTVCRYQITIFTLDGKRVTRIRSERDEFRAATGIRRDVNMRLDPCLLGAGHYFISFAILIDGERDVGVPLGRYDLVARFLDFEVFKTLDYRDSALFFHQAEWQVRESV